MNGLRFKLILLFAELLAPHCAGAQWTEPLRIDIQPVLKTGYAYQVLTKEIVCGDAKRKDSWKIDPRLPFEARPTDQDYDGSGWDRGHLAPASSYGYQLLCDRTFFISNCSPQNPDLNRGLWREIEDVVNELAVQPNAITYVFTAPLLLPDDKGIVTFPTIGPHHVPVGTHWAKAALTVKPQGISAIAWIVPNIEPPHGAHHLDYKATVDDVEAAAGVELFGWLDHDTEKRVEGTK